MHRAVAALLFALAPVSAAAQGLVRGTVRDKDGASISGANIAIPGTTLSTRSDLQGLYRITDVPPGRVRVYAAALGYGPVDTVVALTSGSRRRRSRSRRSTWSAIACLISAIVRRPAWDK